mmetsp:Transcript_32128/g.35971  ORF Transcript_32128/g.35971 Transcript_32128/m.35971 type:complete len:453 (-) Transcript_32128:167-1525(-)
MIHGSIPRRYFSRRRLSFILLIFTCMTWVGTIVGMISGKSIITSCVFSFGKLLSSSLSSRGPLLAEATRISVPGRAERKELHCHSYSLWSCRGGETETGDNEKKISSSSSDTGNDGKRNPRISLPIGSLTYRISVGSEQGYRSYMEDEFFVSTYGDFAAVFDGHGGRAVSRYLRKNLYANIQAFLPLSILEKQDEQQIVDNKNVVIDKETERLNIEKNQKDNLIHSNVSTSQVRPRNPTINDYESALESALEKVDSEILKISHWSFQGSTCCCVWFHEVRDDNESSTRRTIVAANVGDSRAVLCRNNKAWDLSRDHKPNDPTEKARIEGLGGSVIWCGETDELGKPIEDRGIFRVNGNLALSRAIGDRSERPHVTAEPEIISVPIEEGDQFVIIATDGLWDVMDSGDAVNHVKFLLDAGISRGKVATQMAVEALRRGTYDNVTVVIIWMDPK